MRSSGSPNSIGMSVSKFEDNYIVNHLRKFQPNRLAGSGERLRSRSCKISDFQAGVENAGFSAQRPEFFISFRVFGAGAALPRNFKSDGGACGS